MKKFKKIFVIPFVVIILSFNCTTKNQKFNDGDIIFHTSLSKQSKMLEMATNSKFTHVGVIFYKKGKPYVFEAVQPVKITPLSEFINRGKNKHYKVMRYNKPLSLEQKNNMMSWAKKQLGKSYDIKFQWSNNKMYCSELVWKMFNSVGITICDTKNFSDFNLSHSLVQSAIQNRYNKQNFEKNEIVVAPVDISESNNLETIFSNY